MITQQSNYIPIPRPVRMTDAEKRSHPAAGDPALVAFFGGPPSMAGVTVNETTAMSVSSVFACVRNLAEDEAKLPLITYQRLEPRGKRRAPEHPIYKLLHDSPNPEMTAFSFRQAITASAALFGGGYAEIERTNGDTPLHLWPIEPWRVRPKRIGLNGRELVYEIDHKTILTARDVLHIPGFGLNGVLGYMVANVGREALGLTIAAQRFAAAYFGNGTKYAGVFSHPKGLSDQALKHLLEQRAATHQGPDAAHKDLVLEEGMTWTKVSADGQESQLLETRQFQIEEVCRWFRMQPGKIGHLLRAQGWSTLEATNTDYVIDTLMPWFVRWEQEAGRKLVGPNDAGVFCEHLVDGLLRGDSTARAAFYKAMRELGCFNADDICELENRNPLPDGQGETYLVPMNMMDARKASQNDPTVNYKREIVKSLIADGTVADVIANLTAMKELVRQSGLPVNEEYNDPYLPVQDDQGRPVTGEVLKDSENDVVGGVASPAPAAPRTDNRRQDQQPKQADANPGGGAAAPTETRSQVSHADSVATAGRIAEAHRPALMDAAARAARREAEVVRRKAKNPDGLTDAINTFYGTHGEYVRSSIRPAIAALAGTLRAVGFAADETAVDRWASEYVTESRGAMLAAAAGDPAGAAERVDAALADWEQRRAGAITERIIQDMRTPQ